MTSTSWSPSPGRHLWISPAAAGGPGTEPAPGGAERSAPGDLPGRPVYEVRCHRRLRGPYTGGGALMRAVVPELAERHGALLEARATEVIALAADLAPMVPIAPQTLTALASRAERTRFYSVARTLRVAHGITELLVDWARALHPDGVELRFRELDRADPTDRELVSVLLRRCDPALIRVVVDEAANALDPETAARELAEAEAAAAQGIGAPSIADDELARALGTYAERAEASAAARIEPPAGADAAQLFIDGECTSTDPRLAGAYDALPAAERAARHDARAAYLAEHGEPGSALGARLYHLEHGSDAMAAGNALVEGCEVCFDGGFYEAALDMAVRGRALFGDERPKPYWNLTNKTGACLSYLRRGEKGFSYFAELRAGSTDPEIHMNSCYMMAMLYTRHLPKNMHDETRATEWVNTAIAFADSRPDPHRRVFVGAFMRNAKALVELHRGDLPASLDLVNDAIAMTDADLGPDEQLLHRSVLRYNRAQILAALGDHDGSLADYDLVISRDPDYGDYYFERAGGRRAAGRYDAALEDYAEAIRLSPPFHEAHFNRADMLREMGEDEAALRDLDYAAILDPSHVDTLVNRADLLIALGELDRAADDVRTGLALDAKNVRLLCAQGTLLAESEQAEAAFASFTAALEADPEFAAAWANRAIIAYSAGRPEDAVDDLDHAVALADDPMLRANRALALQELGEHARALADLDIAVPALADEDPDLLYRRGTARRALGDAEGARADFAAHLAAYAELGEASPFAADLRGLAESAA
ncbi:Tetratricopeptide repeat-containing protein [Actinacidiphila rubida]|uniref:Tetratricopeptide repeat-containing protein n=3 Tax=Actinacidiphila rubida TaxID=310780 RepID=A0A1H8GKT9_9ACTN|nr:tetratricopeptide repeat protein [Actinacidiphila rubida]SEN44364.1 Tetratricopeptide repeat-containing protein [Actinacidiphila rubida]